MDDETSTFSHLYSAFLVFTTTQSALHYMSFTHIHTLMAGVTTQGANLLIRGNLTIHTPLAQQQEQFGVKCLALRHIDMWTGGAGNRIANLPIGLLVKKILYYCLVI